MNDIEKARKVREEKAKEEAYAAAIKAILERAAKVDW